MKQVPYRHYITFILVVLSLSCIKQSPTAASSIQKVSVMTFNVENLFDTEHDNGKQDYTFLPLDHKKKSKEHNEFCETIKVFKWKDECKFLDWSPSILSMKMKNLANAILQVNEGRGADVLIFQEVENKKVLEDFVNKHLKKSGYKNIVLLEGKDVRGIDVAIVTRLALAGDAILHEIPFEQISHDELKDTRGILEVTVKLPDQTKMVVYANHFPAPFHKRQYRIQAYQFLNSLIRKKSPDTLQLAGGDFNTPGDENQKYNILKENVETDWIVAHQVAYKGTEGSSYYPKDKTWSFLDMLLVSKNLSDGKGWEWNPHSFQIVNQAKGQLTAEGFPQTFDPRTGVGISDHLPLYVELELKK